MNLIFISKANLKQQGFTLLELLIAMVIFALLSAIAYTGLNQVMIAKQRTDQHAKRLTDLQRTFTVMGRDVEQTIGREIRDEYGSPVPALVGNIYGNYLMELTHAGWRNPARNPRSNLQRVAYTVRDEKLIRFIWYMLDRAQDSTPFEVVVLEGVKQFEFRYMDDKKEWHSSWPDTLGPNPVRTPPRAVEVMVETTEFGKIKRKFRVPG